MSIQRLVCTDCGAEANAACNCGVDYIAKSVRARKAIEDNPEKSDRAIADDIGVSPMTVNRARATVPDVTVERTGRDGKTRRMPERNARSVEDDSTREDADVAQARKGQRGTAVDDDSGATITETDTRLPSLVVTSTRHDGCPVTSP
jgi:hypothetical protein